jgi:hypothetical protein
MGARTAATERSSVGHTSEIRVGEEDREEEEEEEEEDGGGCETEERDDGDGGEESDESTLAMDSDSVRVLMTARSSSEQTKETER